QRKQAEQVECYEFQWFGNAIEISGLVDFATINFTFLGPALVAAFVESWYKKTDNFHIFAEEITMRLDDVSCQISFH
ncbi:hypothetical protein L195_g058944, partial [Trifolium pratense]